MTVRPITLLVSMMLVAILASPLVAQGFRDGDQRLSASQVTDSLRGNIIEFFDGSKARYRADGRYSYTYTDDTAPFLGVYEAGDAGSVCVTFDNGARRCDTFVRAGGRLVLVIADGTRFPVRSVNPL